MELLSVLPLIIKALELIKTKDLKKIFIVLPLLPILIAMSLSIRRLNQWFVCQKQTFLDSTLAVIVILVDFSSSNGIESNYYIYCIYSSSSF